MLGLFLQPKQPWVREDSAMLSLDDIVTRERELLDMMRAREGFYERPYVDGKPDGPLVGFAARYEVAPDVELQLVGEKYFNYRRGESSAKVNMAFAQMLMDRHPLVELVQSTASKVAICALPNGGLTLGPVLASRLMEFRSDIEYLYPDKVFGPPAQEGGKPTSWLEWVSHVAEEGMDLIGNEDVCNNFATTNQFIKIANERGARVVALVCALNCSTKFDTHFVSEAGEKIPVFPAIRLPYPSYRQDDPFVRADIEAGNVVLKTKAEWWKLQEAMERQKARARLRA